MLFRRICSRSNRKVNSSGAIRPGSLVIEYAAAYPRHCEPTGRANARPMIGSAKQSILSLRGAMDCFRLRQGFGGQVAALAMTEDTSSRSRGTMRPRFAGNFRDLSKTEGAGNAGCALHPRSHVQRVEEVRT
jgi:hypothetical protein